MVTAVPEYELAYVAVPKAACTAVKSMMLQLLDAASDAVDAANVHRHLPTRRFRRRRFADFAGFYRFTVVRDPVERLLSVYEVRMASEEGLVPNEVKTDLPRNPDPDFFFQNLGLYMQAVPGIKRDALQEQLFTGDNLRKYDAVYTTDEVGKLCQDLSYMTGKRINAPDDEPSSLSLGWNDLAPETQAALRAHTEPDYQMLGDLFTPPWADEALLSAG